MKYPSGGAGSAPLLTTFHFEALFMSCIDYTVENCFAVLGCFNRLETAEKPFYKKIYLIYTALEFL